MNVQGLGAASAGSALAIKSLEKAMDLQATTAAQLLQSLPPAPQPAHLGGGFDVYA